MHTACTLYTNEIFNHYKGQHLFLRGPYGNGFDVANYALIVPILPFLVKELNSTSMQEGLLFSAYSVMQLISILQS